jgi:putative oxidoreductase
MSALVVSKQSSYIAAFGRLLMALIFVISGAGKIAAPAMTLGYIASAGLPLPVVGYFLAIAIEIGGGILLAVGFRTRIVAVAMAAFSAATALIFHHDFADPNQMMHFLKNLAMTGGLLQIVAFGGGVFSIDGFESSLRPASARSFVSRVCSLEEVQS